MNLSKQNTSLSFTYVETEALEVLTYIEVFGQLLTDTPISLKWNGITRQHFLTIVLLLLLRARLKCNCIALIFLMIPFSTIFVSSRSKYFSLTVLNYISSRVRLDHKKLLSRTEQTVIVWERWKRFLILIFK